MTMVEPAYPNPAYASMFPGTCVLPSGRFINGVHRPRFSVLNLRENDFPFTLGRTEDGRPHDNRANFPAGDIEAAEAGVVYEIPNPFPFRGVTYISAAWADEKAKDPSTIALPAPPDVSFSEFLSRWPGRGGVRRSVS